MKNRARLAGLSLVAVCAVAPASASALDVNVQRVKRTVYMTINEPGKGDLGANDRINLTAGVPGFSDPNISIITSGGAPLPRNLGGKFCHVAPDSARGEVLTCTRPDWLVIDTGAGNDYIEVELGVADKLAVTGSSGDDVIYPEIRPPAFLTRAERASLSDFNSEFSGGSGDDTVSANETPIWTSLSIGGGPGNDILGGAGGGDYINGGLGVDIIDGYGGDDQLSGRDRGFDWTNCGTGRDAAFIDGNDWADLSCETVERR